jgi:hypothetical protein
MRLNSTSLGVAILVILVGGIVTASSLGVWQTQGGGGQNRNHGGEGETIPVVSLHGVVGVSDPARFEIVTDEGQNLQIGIGNTRYNQSIGFAPQAGEAVTVSGFWDESGGFSAVAVTLDRTGQVYTFRDASGHPLWTGGNGNRP